MEKRLRLPGTRSETGSHRKERESPHGDSEEFQLEEIEDDEESQKDFESFMVSKFFVIILNREFTFRVKRRIIGENPKHLRQKQIQLYGYCRERTEFCKLLKNFAHEFVPMRSRPVVC